MARYLSDEWFEAVADALRDAPDADADVVIEQRVDGGPDGVVVWHLRLAAPTIVARGSHPSPSVTFHQTYETAVAIARGELSAQEAFMTGRITLSGNAGALIAAAPALVAVGDALATVRAATTY